MTYKNDTIKYYYRIYSTLSGIWPISGPTSGGTLLRVSGNGFDETVSCKLDGYRILPIKVNT